MRLKPRLKQKRMSKWKLFIYLDSIAIFGIAAIIAAILNVFELCAVFVCVMIFTALVLIFKYLK